MLRYEATNSHNYTWIAELRPDFDMFRARERKRTSSRLGMLATNRLTDVSVSYLETVERYARYTACITGHQQRSSFPAGIVITTTITITTTSAPSLPVALTRTLAVRRSTRAHHCYKCRSSHRHSRCSSSSQRVKFERVGKTERRLSLLSQEVVISATRITRFGHNPARATFPRNYLRSWPTVTVKLPTA
ncbi:hypothetical protein ALC62_13678 [Cyphomyrmex costatus]|uniref:Uncharacterized protein n=1 Tax=Cyphomyrmex costatus TaxID=456900 RepID=A0A151I9H2_9HYME|nr:hypothetical protein ALC62_13678 [Cyphomyrmex costatus]